MSLRPSSPIAYVVWAFIAFAVYNLSFWVAQPPTVAPVTGAPVFRPAKMGETSIKPDGTEEVIWTEIGKTKSKKPDPLPRFDKLGPISHPMPRRARVIHWVNGVRKQQWCSVGTRFSCPSLTDGEERELEVLGVREVQINGSYFYRMDLEEVKQPGTLHVLELQRSGDHIRLYQD